MKKGQKQICTVSIIIDEATMRQIDPRLTSRESIGQWLQHQVDIMIEEMIAEDVKPYTVEELLERAEKGRKEIACGNYVKSEDLFRDLFEKFEVDPNDIDEIDRQLEENKLQYAEAI